jgi:hypothetical protein
MSFLRYALYCGVAAGAASVAAVMLESAASGRSPLRPVNATSHWIHGREAGRREQADVSHTLTGALTNQGAAMFWGSLFAAWLTSRPRRTTGEMFRDAAVMGAIAATLDYGILPRRLTPGWELAGGARSAVVGMTATAIGLALGGLAAQGGPAPRPRHVPRHYFSGY